MLPDSHFTKFFFKTVRSSSRMACYLKEDKSEIIISGYSRQRYTHSVPVALLKLIQSFYTLWKKRRLTQGELDEICQLQPGATSTITLHSLRVNRTKLKEHDHIQL